MVVSYVRVVSRTRTFFFVMDVMVYFTGSVLILHLKFSLRVTGSVISLSNMTHM